MMVLLSDFSKQVVLLELTVSSPMSGRGQKSEVVEAAEELGPPANLLRWVISRAVSSPGTRTDWLCRVAREATRNIHETAETLCSGCG